MAAGPLVSVLMPARNAGRYLRAAVQSVLAQTLRDLELVVVDDGSTDDTRQILAGVVDPRLVVVRLEASRGLPHALNHGVRAARAELIARLDADDVALPDRLERQLAAMRAAPPLALLGTRAHLIDTEGRRLGNLDRPLGAHAIRWYHLFDNPFVHSTVMFRRAVVRDELGGYDESFLTATEDWDLWSRILRRHPAANLPDRLIEYRTHPASMIGGVDPARRRDDIRRIVATNAAVTLALRLTPTEVDLVTAFLLGLDRPDRRAWVALIVRMMAAFRAAYPDAGVEGEPWGTLGRQLDALAARARPDGRATALALYAAAVRREPRLLRTLPIARVIARLTLGTRGLARLRARRIPPRRGVTESG
jgi:glycosyltransferase involved in cell wall biosynthesis